MMRLLVAFFVLMLFCSIQPAAVMGQSLPKAQSETSAASLTPVLPEKLTPEMARQLVSQLTDEQVRQLLLDRLDAVARQHEELQDDEGASTIQFLVRVAVVNYETVVDALVRLPLLVSLQFQSFQNFVDKLGTEVIGWTMLAMLSSFAAAVFAEWVSNFAVKRWLDFKANPAQEEASRSLRETLRFLGLRLIKDLASLVVFLIVLGELLILLVAAEARPYAWGFFLYLVALPRTMAAIFRFLLAPLETSFRIVSTDDATARYLHWHQISLVALIGFTIYIVEFNELNDIAMGQSRLGFWLNLSIHLYIIFIVWQAWDGLVTMMRGAAEELSVVELRIVAHYPTYAMVVTMGTWFLVNTLTGFEQYALLRSTPHFKMMFVLLMVPAIDTGIRGLIRNFVPPMKGEGMVAERAYVSTKLSYVRIGRVLGFVLALFLIAGFWGFGFADLAAAGVGEKFGANLLAVLLILATGYLVWEVITLLINRKLAAEHTATGLDPGSGQIGGGEGGGATSSRLSTVLPIVRFTLQVVVVILTVLIALGNIGIDVTPLLAGAGILGLAVGFGAQTLVRDVVSGIFFLVDDAFRIGEYIVVGSTVGTVERISLRSLQMRHHEGPVHTIPYGEIPQVTNNSRDWIIMKLKFTFPFDTDPNRIKKIFKQVGQDMLQAQYADDLLETFKSQGVYDVNDVGVVIRGKFMARPGNQWVIRKDVYNRVQQALEEAGIQFARKEVRVQIPGMDKDAELTAEQKKAIAAGASDAVEKLDEQAGKK